MNIAIIGSAHPLRGGGISTFNERLAEVLQEEGHTVTIWSFSLQYPSLLFPGKSQFTEEAPPAGLRILSRINSINPLNWIRTGRALKKAAPDLILVRYWLPFMGPCFGAILRIAKRNKKNRVLCIADNILPHEHRPGDAAFTRYFMKPVDAFITMSRQVLKDLAGLTKKPAAYTPHPLYDNYGEAVNTAAARRRLGLPEEGRYILFFGFIRKYKGLDLLLEAMSDSRIQQQNIRLIIAGEYYDDRAEYDAIISRLALENSIHAFTEFIPNDEIRYYFSAADLIVQPYRSATQSGITQIAYHFEKPMVVTNVGGLPEVVPNGKTGLVAEPEPVAIAEAILQYFEKGIPGLKTAILKEKAQYSWSAFTERIMHLYRSLDQ